MTLDYEPRSIAGVTNDPELVELAAASARTVVGDDGLVWLDAVTPAFSEDFGSFLDDVPGVMFFLGVSNEDRGWVGMPHTSGYVADEDAIFTGAEVMAAIVLDIFDR
jgi:metal-dependent amidase/aminoacylase/carboxypeptidase family protein